MFEAESLPDPTLDGLAKFVQAAGEEVVGGLDENEFLRIGSGGHQCFEFFARAEGVMGPADK